MRGFFDRHGAKTVFIALGVHYFSDVVAGFAAGTVWLAACISGVEVARRRACWPGPSLKIWQNCGTVEA